eukprot:365629-Chlamydomonas_euryale.AAC.4
MHAHAAPAPPFLPPRRATPASRPCIVRSTLRCAAKRDHDSPVDAWAAHARASLDDELPRPLQTSASWQRTGPHPAGRATTWRTYQAVLAPALLADGRPYASRRDAGTLARGRDRFARVGFAAAAAAPPAAAASAARRLQA